MANFVERFKAGYALTDDEWCERKGIENAKRGYYSPALNSLEIHPTFAERVWRGIRFVLEPEEMRKGA